MQEPFLTSAQLARRWNLSSITLTQWRWSGFGPAYHKIGGRINYFLKDIEAFENERKRKNTTDTGETDSNDLKKSKELWEPILKTTPSKKRN